MKVFIAGKNCRKSLMKNRMGFHQFPRKKNINVKVGHLPLMFFFEDSHKC